MSDASATKPDSKPWSPLRALLVCQTWAFVLFLPINLQLTTENNRYCIHWDRTLFLSYLGATTILGLVLFGLGLLLRWCAPRGYAVIAGLAALLSLIFLAWSRLLTEMAYYFLPLAGLTPFAVLFTIGLMSFLHKKGIGIVHIQRWLAIAGLLLAPLVPIFWVSLLLENTYDEGSYPSLEKMARRAEPQKKLTPADNVYIFIFDEWSYRLTMSEDGLPAKKYPHLRQFGQEACVFANGHSPACHTIQALPRILFERDDDFVLHRGRPGFWTKKGFQDCARLPNLFTKARERGFRTYMVGWHHPYPFFLGRSVDYCYALPSIKTVRKKPLDCVRQIYWNFAHQLAGEYLSRTMGFGDHLLVNTTHLDHVKKLFGRTATVLGEKHRRGQFAVFHLPLPHPPFIFSADGKLTNLHILGRVNSTTLYQRQNVFLDRKIGELLSVLKNRGKYDNSIIVFAGDHTFRDDPGMAKTIRNTSHTPLLIRFPGQAAHVLVHERFSTSNLLRLFDAVRSPDTRVNEIGALIAREDWYHEISPSELLYGRVIVK